MENNKITAVEWLVSQYEEHRKTKGSLYGFRITKKMQNQALQMEKEQIIEAYVEGINEPLENPKQQSEQYYKQTYGKIYIEKPFDQQNGSY